MSFDFGVDVEKSVAMAPARRVGEDSKILFWHLETDYEEQTTGENQSSTRLVPRIEKIRSVMGLNQSKKGKS